MRGRRVAAFASSGALGAVAGVYDADYYGNVVASDFSLQVNMDALLAVLLGGSQSLLGPLFARRRHRRTHALETGGAGE